MEVEVNGLWSHTGHYLRLYRKIADQLAWPQVLVLYEDGYLRIKSHPPEGIQDICFGSSVVIGPVVVGDRPYADVTYQDLYSGIDLIYSGKQSHLKSEFVVAPGADPAAITMDYSGASDIYVRADGALVLETPIGKLIEARPLIYQMIDGERVTVDGGYRLLGNREVAFSFWEYDPKESLIIDPALVYFTHLGGSDSDYGYAIAVDDLGNAYITGYTWSDDFPKATPLQSTYGGFGDVFVAKLNASLRRLTAACP